MPGVEELDVLAIGETLIDLISDEEQGSQRFLMYPGGAVTNVALNVSRLGGRAGLVARVGDDAFGEFLRRYLDEAGVATSCLHITPHIPTTLVIVTSRSATPEFSVYRGADAEMIPGDMPYALLSSTSLVHTSAFALSREPSRSTVLEFVAQARAAGCRISFDPNYHPRLWEIDADPTSVFAKICSYVTLAKPSLDDCVRLFGVGQTPEHYAGHFLNWGVQNVILTMGAAGVLLANAQGTSHYPTGQIEVVDVTGAGDSFWAGLLLATLDGYTLPDAIRVAQEVAAIKLGHIGPLSHTIDRAELYKHLGLK